MKPRIQLIAATLLAAFLSACATLKMAVTADDPSLYLAQPCKRVATFGIDQSVTLPAGEYRPTLKDDGGTYYAPPGDIIGAFNMVLSDRRLYVATDGRHALWTIGGRLSWLDAPVPLKAAKHGAGP
jgi:hypothetical protein